MPIKSPDVRHLYLGEKWIVACAVFLSSRYVSPPQVLRKSQKVTERIFREINNGENKFTFSHEFERLQMFDIGCQTQNARMGCQAAVIGQASPGPVWDAWAAPTQL